MPASAGELAGQRAQQGGLAGAVDADQADDVTGGDDEVEAGEQDAGAVAGGQAAGDEGGAHGLRVPIRAVERAGQDGDYRSESTTRR